MNYLLTHPFLSLIIGAGLAVLILAAAVLELYRRWRRIFGQRAATATGALAEVLQRLGRAESRLASLEPRAALLEEIGRVAVQRVGFLRFNPFAETGGDQSFALALLDGELSGVIISSLYTREGVRVYAKRVERGVAKHALSVEERAVLAQALAGKP